MKSWMMKQTLKKVPTGSTCLTGRMLRKEIAMNYTFIKPLVKAFPDRVPGCILLTDIWLYLNRIMGEKLLCKPEGAQVQAAQEASRCKKLIGALRYLYRNSFSAKHIWFMYILFVWCYFTRPSFYCVLCDCSTSLSGKASHHPRVTELKSFLEPSPSAATWLASINSATR